MLPFLKQKRVAGLIIANRKPDGTVQESHHSDDEDAGLHAASADLIRAIHAKDDKQVSDALRAAFEILDSQPHDEGEHTNEEDRQE